MLRLTSRTSAALTFGLGLCVLPLLTGCGGGSSEASRSANLSGRLVQGRADTIDNLLVVGMDGEGNIVDVANPNESGRFELELEPGSEAIITVLETDASGAISGVEGVCGFPQEAGGLTTLIGIPLDQEIDLGEIPLTPDGEGFLGVPTTGIAGLDFDKDGVSDFKDIDDNNNGVPDVDEQAWICGFDDAIPFIFDQDWDDDGIPNADDTDMDGDGKVDTEDADRFGFDAGGLALPIGIDVDGNGVPNWFEFEGGIAGGIPEWLGQFEEAAAGVVGGAEGGSAGSASRKSVKFAPTYLKHLI